MVEGEVAARSKSSPLYSWLVIVILMLLYTSSFIDRQILSLLVKPIRSDLAITDTEFSLIAGFAFVIMYSIAGIPLGMLVDRWSRRAVIIIGVTVWSLMTASCGLANSYVRLFASRIGVGIGEATLSPASYSLISDYFPAERLSRALSVYGLGIPIGSGLALVIGGPLVQWLTDLGPMDLPVVGVTKPWQTVFIVIGLPGLLLALLTFLAVREPPRHEDTGAVDVEARPSLGAIFAFLWQNRRIYGSIFLGLGFIAMFSYGANAWYPAYLQRVHHFSVAQAGLFLGGATVVFGILGSISAGFLADRLIAKGYADGHFLVGMLYGAGVVVCGVIGPLAPVEWVSLTFIAITGFFSNTWVGVNAAVLQIVTPNRMRGQVSALYLFTAALIAAGLGPTAVAAATDHIFGRDDAVGSSLALVAFVFPIIGIAVMHSGRGHLRILLKRKSLQGFG